VFETLRSPITKSRKIDLSILTRDGVTTFDAGVLYLMDAGEGQLPWDCDYREHEQGASRVARGTIHAMVDSRGDKRRWRSALEISVGLGALAKQDVEQDAVSNGGRRGFLRELDGRRKRTVCPGGIGYFAHFVAERQQSKVATMQNRHLIGEEEIFRKCVPFGVDLDGFLG
jgi:hypothetical protein